MSTDILESFEVADEFKYDFPYGDWAEPQIQVLSGPYQGLIVDILCSGIGKHSDDDFSKFTYTYKIKKMWNESSGQINKDDEFYIGKLVLNLIKQENNNA